MFNAVSDDAYFSMPFSMGKQMEKNMKIWLSLAVVSFCAFVQANEKVVNVYAWPQEVSLEIIEKFHIKSRLQIKNLQE